MRKLKGIGVSPGVTAGRAILLKQSTLDFRVRIPVTAVEGEIAKLQDARDRSKEQLLEIKASVASTAGPEHAYLFDAQLLMLDDPMLVPRAISLIRRRQLNAEWAVERAFKELTSVFDQVKDPYLHERKGDIADIVGRLRLNLRGGASPLELFNALSGPHVLITDELAPSLAAQIDWTRITGFTTDVGSWTYHTAILARSWKVPAVVGLHHASATIAAGEVVVIDGTAGELLVDPPSDVLELAKARGSREQSERVVSAHPNTPATTADGIPIRLEANIERPEDAVGAKAAGAQGIGLYRSEYLLAQRSIDALDEGAQHTVYRSILEQMSPAPVTIRTFDAGETQLSRPLPDATGAGRLGLRAIRLSLQMRDIFRTQLRALLRAAQYGRLRILFPFVADVEEVREARKVVEEVAEALRQEGIVVPRVPLGVMIEVPSAALTADMIAEQADFFSIGTNDLIQYSLAVDRSDDRVSDLYQPRHPAILRLIRFVSRTGRRRALPVAVCGEMASDPLLLALLIGLGVREFSMRPAAIPLVKRVIGELRVDDLKALANRAIRGANLHEIEVQLASILVPATRER